VVAHSAARGPEPAAPSTRKLPPTSTSLTRRNVVFASSNRQARWRARHARSRGICQSPDRTTSCEDRISAATGSDGKRRPGTASATSGASVGDHSTCVSAHTLRRNSARRPRGERARRRYVAAATRKPSPARAVAAARPLGDTTIASVSKAPSTEHIDRKSMRAQNRSPAPSRGPAISRVAVSRPSSPPSRDYGFATHKSSCRWRRRQSRPLLSTRYFRLQITACQNAQTVVPQRDNRQPRRQRYLFIPTTHDFAVTPHYSGWPHSMASNGSVTTRSPRFAQGTWASVPELCEPTRCIRSGDAGQRRQAGILSPRAIHRRHGQAAGCRSRDCPPTHWLATAIDTSGHR